MVQQLNYRVNFSLVIYFVKQYLSLARMVCTINCSSFQLKNNLAIYGIAM